ncbi:DNA replication factor Cdt1 isoform X2 [Venturia canescens]|nr:DNA replication factor Cdt1 isoform X2 [Venturia canescens]
MTPKAGMRTRATRVKKFTSQEGQTDIRETFFRMTSDSPNQGTTKVVPFEKMGLLSPRKKNPVESAETQNDTAVENIKEAPAAGSVTPKKASAADRLTRRDLNLGEIKKRINTSSRLNELKASIARFRKCEEKIEQLEKKHENNKPQIRKFQSIELEVPVSPSKLARLPNKSMLSPTKSIQLPANASPQRRLLFAPKESPASPTKCSPTKIPAYQRYQTLVDSGTPALPLPYNYKFIAEAFRCVDTVAAMLFNRKEVVTFNKLKPAVQELLRRNFTLEHLAQIKTIYPEAFVFSQEKLRNFGSTSKQDRYELVVTPIVEPKNEKQTTNPDNVLKSASEIGMGPGVMLERRRKFYKSLLDKVKDEHEKFLLSLETPMRIPKEKITRWHPEFDVEKCPSIELSVLPEAPNAEKSHSAKEVLERAKTLFNCNTRMEKALQRLADAKMTSNSSVDVGIETTLPNPINNESSSEMKKVEISIVDTPPATPTTQQMHLNSAFKGIPKALLERVRAKQAAKALEAMTRTPTADKEAALYSRLPEMAKILRNIFVVEKKGVLPLDTVITKLDNSYKTKLTPNELEEHVRLICKLLPTFACLQKVRQIDYLKLAKTADIVKVVKRLEIIANEKVDA